MGQSSADFLHPEGSSPVTAPASLPGSQAIVKIRDSGEKKTIFYNNQNSPEPLNIIRADSFRADTPAHDTAEQKRRNSSLFKYRIIRNESSDYQQGTVAGALPGAMEVIAKDEYGNPAAGVSIVFASEKGGGHFSGGQSVINVSTDENGKAGAVLTLGERTDVNPYGWKETGKNLQQVGLNTVRVYPESERDNSVFFQAFGFPDTPHELSVVRPFPADYHDSVLDIIWQMGVLVLDIHGNPVSDAEVEIEPSAIRELGSCMVPAPQADNRPMLLVPAAEFGETQYNVLIPPLSYEQYRSYSGPLTIKSKHIPVFWWILSGSADNAEYPFTIRHNTLAVEQSFVTEPFGNCDGKSLPDSEVHAVYVGADSPETGQYTMINGWLYIMREKSVETVSDCWACETKLLGTREFYIDNQFTADSVTIAGVPVGGTLTDHGIIYSLTYIPPDSIYSIDLTFQFSWNETGKLTYSDCFCSGTLESSGSIDGNLIINPISVAPPEEPVILVLTAGGRLKCDTEFPVTVNNYHPNQPKYNTCRLNIYENGILLHIIPFTYDNSGSLILPEGLAFDPSLTYTATVTAYDTEDNSTGVTGDSVSLVFEKNIIQSVYVKNPEAFPLLPGGSVQLYAETAAAVSPGDLRWEMAERIPDFGESPVFAEINPETGLLSVNAASGHGYAVIVCRYKDCEYKTARVRIGCEVCGGISCSAGGNGSIGLSSVDIRLSLGESSGGQSGGDIFVTSKNMTPRLYRTEILEYSSLVTGNEVITGADGALRQVLTPQTFADAVTLNDHAYEVRFYRSGDAGPKSDGVYTAVSGADPFVTWRFENPDASSGVQERFRVTEIRNGESTVSEYRYNDALSSWTLSEGGGLRVTEKIRSAENGLQTETETVKDSTGKISSRVRRVSGTFPWGDSVTEKTEGPDGSGLTVNYSYYGDASATGSYGRLQSAENADGSWIYYEYDADGRVITGYRSYADIPITEKGQARRTVYSYDPAAVSGDSDAPEDRNRPRVITESIRGVTVSKTFHAYSVSGEERTEITEICTVPSAAFGDASGLRTVRVRHSETSEGYAAGRVKRLQNPDGTVISYTYENGVYDSVSRTFTPGSGDFIRETAVHGTVSSPEGTAFRTLKETAVKDVSGHTLLTEEYVCTGTGYERISWKSSVYDDFGRPVRTDDSAGRVSETVWNCCGKESETAEDGVQTAYTHDALKRVSTETRPGPQGNITAVYSYDASDRVISETVTGGTLSLSVSREYDTAGRLLSETDSRGLTTAYDYENGGSRKIITRPGGITEITENYADGRVKSVTGTGVIPVFYEYSVNPDSTRSARITQAVSGGPLREETVTDMAGRTVRTEKPGPEGPEISETFYSAQGRISRTAAPGRADMLHDYDETGSTVTTALDVNANGLTDLSGHDRVTRSETLYVQDSGWRRQRTESLLLQSGSPAFTVTGITQERLSGLPAGVISETRNTDGHGNVTNVRTAADRASAIVTVTADYPDSGIDGTSVTVSGFLQSETDKTGLTVTYAYDALGRRTQTADPKTGTVITHYNSSGQVSAVAAPAGQSVTYGYDPVTGRKISETDAAGKITRYAYNDRDQVTHVWGDVPVPVRYEYDDYGRLWKLHTFRTDAGFTGVQWPADAGTGDVTEWVYDSATGLLSSKIYADGKGVTYTYLSGGRLHTRTWARTADGASLVTAYGYDPGTGELTDTDYSGSTPDIHFTYDRAGRKKTVTDALGTRTLTYDGLLPDTEVLTGLYERTLDYAYGTAADGVSGRLSGFSAGSDYQVSYTYEHGRISGENWQTHGQTGSVSYGYENGLLRNSLFSTGLNVTRTHDPAERYLTQVKNGNTSGILSQYDYSHDILGRRETAAYSGAAFDGDSYRRFSYNDRSEVISSSAFAGSDITGTSAPLDSQHRTYTYDPIGNRTAAAVWNDTENIPETAVYTSNALNQYTEIAAPAQTDIPGYDDDGNLLKISADGPVMTYDGENRLSSAEYNGLLGDVNGDKSVNLADAVASLQVAAGMTPPGVTAAGDVSSDGKIGLGEAVHALQVSAGIRTTAAAARKLAFVYDYMGRRVKKAVYADNSLISETLFVYEGWNLIEEITRRGDTESSRYFVWGLDLSQSLQGAGGIGGLLSMADANASYHYLYDANGNVSQLVNAATGEISAHYEYDPFGNLTAKSGVYADANPFRFSTKYFDRETGLYYYGFRDYSAKLGRWTSRDPVNELGNIAVKNIQTDIYSPFNEALSNQSDENYDESIDVNFYQFALNNALNYIDPNGEWVVLVAFVAAKTIAMATSYVVLKTTAYTISDEAGEGVDTAMKMVAEINASEAVSMAAGEVIAVGAGAGLRYFKLCRAPSKSGKLVIEAGKYTASEIRAAEHMSGVAKKVRLRNPTGTRAGGGTSDLLVDGVRYDVYTPKTGNPNRIVSAIAKKNTQAEGIVLDLAETVVTPEQLGNVVKRVHGAGAINIKDIVIIGK